MQHQELLNTLWSKCSTCVNDNYNPEERKQLYHLWCDFFLTLDWNTLNDLVEEWETRKPSDDEYYVEGSVDDWIFGREVAPKGKIWRTGYDMIKDCLDAYGNEKRQYFILHGETGYEGWSEDEILNMIY
jgi:hypothetical protein